MTGRPGSATGRAAVLAATLCLGVGLPAAGEEPSAWLQWGGPSGDFQAPARGLADSWGETGPERLWSREIGDAYSAILFERDRLYTMDWDGEREAVVCLDATDGATLWRTSYDRPPYRWQSNLGIGPRATPLIDGDMLFSVGATGTLLALDKRDGAIVWRRELWGDPLGGNPLSYGYASSPVAYRGTVIAAVGGEGAGLVAFERRTGEIVWRAPSFRNSYSSPRVVRLAGREQLVAFMSEELIALDPSTGELLWRFPHANQWGNNISMPVVAEGDLLFLSSPQVGARGLRVISDGGGLRVEEIWVTRRVQLYHASAVRLGDWVYGSTGVTSPAFLTAVNIRSGEIAWRERGFAKANVVAADGRLVILDENGVLYLARATPGELTVLARAELLDRQAWTVPTIVGTTLYVRDRQRILAVDLG